MRSPKSVWAVPSRRRGMRAPHGESEKALKDCRPCYLGFGLLRSFLGFVVREICWAMNCKEIGGPGFFLSRFPLSGVRER
jgi:hypothetical protein